MFPRSKVTKLHVTFCGFKNKQSSSGRLVYMGTMLYAYQNLFSQFINSSIVMALTTRITNQNHYLDKQILAYFLAESENI